MYSLKVLKYSLFFVLSMLIVGCVEPKVEKKQELQQKIKVIKKKVVVKPKIVEITKPKVVIKVDTTPKWFKNKELKALSKYEVVAYAKDTTLAKAQDKAIQNIVFTMFNRANKSSIGQLDMANLNTLKQEQKDGEFFVALSYINDNFVYKVKSTIGTFECDGEKVNPYMKQTKIFDSFNCNLNIKLERKNKEWYLKYKKNLFALTNEQFKEFFVATKSNKFDFKISKKSLVEEDKFYFTFKTKKRGYITLLDVYKNGIVTLLDTSVDIKRKLYIPAIKDGYKYEATTLNYGENTYDLYVAIFTKKPIELDMFEYKNQDMTTNEKAHKFGELIDILDGYEYSTILVKTKARR